MDLAETVPRTCSILEYIANDEDDDPLDEIYELDKAQTDTQKASDQCRRLQQLLEEERYIQLKYTISQRKKVVVRELQQQELYTQYRGV